MKAIVVSVLALVPLACHPSPPAAPQGGPAGSGPAAEQLPPAVPPLGAEAPAPPEATGGPAPGWGPPPWRRGGPRGGWGRGPGATRWGGWGAGPGMGGGQGMGGGYGMSGGMGLLAGMADLYPPQLVLRFGGQAGVDEATLDGIRADYLEAQKKMAEHLAQARTARIEVARLLGQPKADQKTIDAQIDAAAQALAAMGKLRTRLLASTRARLTPAQRAKLDEIKDRAMGGVGPGPAGRPGVGGRPDRPMAPASGPRPQPGTRRPGPPPAGPPQSPGG